MGPFGAATPVVMGHRGAPLLCPENTPESFRAAAAAGATWVELDARRSAEDIVVVVHDPCTSDGVPVVEQSAAELAAKGIVDLGAVLERLPAGLGVDVELKNLPGEPDYDDTDRLAALVATIAGPHADHRPMLITSFNPSTVLASAAAAPSVPTGLLHAGGLALDAACELAVELGVSVVCPHRDSPGLDGPGVAACHAAGLAVLAWTVNDPDQARVLAEAGVDALCTDDPTGIIHALQPL